MRRDVVSVGVGALLLLGARGAESQDTNDWRADWEVREGFQLEIDSDGYDFPTAIAVVPRPGSAPGNPRYFVTELRGQVKVVTNDGTVRTFASGFTVTRPPKELPSGLGEHGAAGICLAPSQGYVFVTFVYLDSTDVLRNNVIRFDTDPETFSVEPRSQRVFTDVFAADASSNSHQIGGCQVENGMLYVSVGDGLKSENSQFLDATLGKVLRMTMDGQPVPSNPFYTDDGARTARDYVWAYGFRNPFGLKVVNGRWFVAENGLNVDRFLEVEEGRNYLWDGSDWSIGTNADVVFGPAVSPVQTDYYPRGSDLFSPEYRDRFYVATAGLTERPGPGLSGQKSVLTMDYDFDRGAMRSVPRLFFRYAGSGYQVLAGLAFGSDGLYVVPVLPDAEGQSVVLKLSYNPDNQHPYVIGQSSNPAVLMSQLRCSECHVIQGRGGLAGPSLDYDELIPRLAGRIASDDYVRSLGAVDRLDREPFLSYADARREVAAAEGDERIRLWLKYRIMEPRFDTPGSQMPNLGVAEREAEIIAAYLMASPAAAAEPGMVGGLVAALRSRIPVALAFLVGMAFMFVIGGRVVGPRVRRSRTS